MHAQCMLVYSTNISQGSVATTFMRGGNFDDHFVTNFSTKSVSKRIAKIAQYRAKLWT